MIVLRRGLADSNHAVSGPHIWVLTLIELQESRCLPRDARALRCRSQERRRAGSVGKLGSQKLTHKVPEVVELKTGSDASRIIPAVREYDGSRGFMLWTKDIDKAVRNELT